MTYEQPSSLSFSIKESVWLNEGNEIEELLSLALEPDISIREADDQVYIRGSLLLFGEYRPTDEGKEKSGSYSDQVPFRSVEEVQMSDDGIGMIRHSFPLDVTIPREKINRLEDLYVTVDAFDYELPGRGCIELEANISVSGIQNERSTQEHNFANDDEDTAVYNPPPEFNYQEEEREDRSFHFEAIREVTAADDDKEDAVRESVYEGIGQTPEANAADDRTSAFGQQYNNDNDQYNYEDNDNHEVEADYNSEPEQQFNETEYERPSYEPEPKYEPPTYESEPENEPYREPVNYSAEYQTPEWQEEPELVRGEPAVNFSSQASPDQEASFDETEGRDDSTESSAGKDENALYLTKMLTKGEEEFSRLRMCIVQDGESLETIAERYNIPVSNLIRMNRLNEERVSEGQILYIPVQKTPTSKS